jgi:hypothetical protein
LTNESLLQSWASNVTTGHADVHSISFFLYIQINMACIWDAINAALTPAERTDMLGQQPYAAQLLADNVKRRAHEGLHAQPVMVGGEVVAPQQLREGVERLQAIAGVHDGYDCSGCDPLLIWFSARFGWRITHRFVGATIVYAPATGVTRTVSFHASASHITFSGA